MPAPSTSTRPGTRSVALTARAARLTPGGVHSNVRIDAPRVFFERGEGAWLYDVDGNDYVDHLLGQGPNFLGHACRPVLDAVAAACQRGTIYAGQHELEIVAAEAVHGALLIFDEVICGFRLALGGAAERFGVTPDLATYGKAIAGGWPVAAMAGRADVLDPIGTGAVNHSGTLNSSVMSMAAVAAAIEVLRDDPPYERIERYGEQLRAELTRLGDEHGIALRVQGLPAALHASIGDGAVVDAASLAANRDAKAYASLASELTARGVWVAGRGVWYTSAAHGERELDAVVERADAALAAFAARGGAGGS